MIRSSDRTLVELVDSIVAAVDSDRFDEVARLREALAPFGGLWLFDDELRLNGRPDAEHSCCFGECVDALDDLEVAA